MFQVWLLEEELVLTSSLLFEVWSVVPLPLVELAARETGARYLRDTAVDPFCRILARSRVQSGRRQPQEHKSTAPAAVYLLSNSHVWNSWGLPGHGLLITSGPILLNFPFEATGQLSHCRLKVVKTELVFDEVWKKGFRFFIVDHILAMKLALLTLFLSSFTLVFGFAAGSLVRSKISSDDNKHRQVCR